MANSVSTQTDLKPGKILEAAPGVFFEITACDSDTVSGRFSGETELFTFLPEEVRSFTDTAKIPREIDIALNRAAAAEEVSNPSRFAGADPVYVLAVAAAILTFSGALLFLIPPVSNPNLAESVKSRSIEAIKSETSSLIVSDNPGPPSKNREPKKNDAQQQNPEKPAIGNSVSAVPRESQISHASQVPKIPQLPPAWDSKEKPPELLSLDELVSGAGGKSPLSLLPEEFMASMEEAEGILNRGNPREAVVKLRPLLLLNPKNPRINTFLGQAYMSLGLLEMAETILKKAHELSPGSLDILVFLGRTEAALDRMDAFDNWLSVARKVDPSRKTVDLLFAEALADAGKFDDATSLLPPDADDLADDLSRIHTRMKARTLLNAGKPADAFELLNGLVSKKGGGARTRQNLEFMMDAVEAGNLWVRAVNPLKKCIADGEESADGYGWLGKVMYRLGDPSAAVLAFENHFTAAGRGKADFLEMYGQSLFELGRAYEALAAFDEARVLMEDKAPESLVSTINRLRFLTDPDPF